MTKKLSTMPYANAKVIINNDTIALVSYKTTVAVIRDNWLFVNGLYSMTTRKHIGAFMREYTSSNYQTAKYIFENDYAFNILTGEVVNANEIF